MPYKNDVKALCFTHSQYWDVIVFECIVISEDTAIYVPVQI